MSESHYCRVYWGSHGCSHLRGHAGPHKCSCCDCINHAVDHGHLFADDVLCVAKPPYYGPGTKFYGEDVLAIATSRPVSDQQGQTVTQCAERHNASEGDE